MNKTAYFGDGLRADYATGTTRITDLVKKLNKSYFEQNLTSENENMKAIAYMLDTKAWSDFKDNTGNAVYAVGGPSIEMLINSYNQKHNVSYKAEVKLSVEDSVNVDGYQISHDNGTTWAHSYSDMLDTNDSLYVNDTEINNAYGYWVASPSAYDSNYIIDVLHNGGIGSCGYKDNIRAFRPLICLNSNVQLQESGDGFIIK